MNEIQLRYFCTLAKTEHLNKAAEKLFISPPSLSIMIRRIEAELGVPLFEKKGRNIALTNYGRLFLPKAQAALDILDRGRQELIDARSEEDSSVDIMGGSVSSFPELLSLLLRSNRHITFEKGSFNSENELLSMLLSGRVDIYIGSVDLHDKNVEKYELYRERQYLVASRTHPLADSCSISAEDLAGQSFIACSEHTIQGKQFKKFCETIGLNPNVTTTGTSTRMLLETAELDPSVIVMIPERLLTYDTHARNLKKLDLAFEMPYVTVYIIRSKVRHGKAPADHIWEIVVDYFQKNYNV